MDRLDVVQCKALTSIIINVIFQKINKKRDKGITQPRTWPILIPSKRPAHMVGDVCGAYSPTPGACSGGPYPAPCQADSARFSGPRGSEVLKIFVGEDWGKFCDRRTNSGKGGSSWRNSWLRPQCCSGLGGAYVLRPWQNCLGTYVWISEVDAMDPVPHGWPERTDWLRSVFFFGEWFQT